MLDKSRQNLKKSYKLTSVLGGNVEVHESDLVGLLHDGPGELAAGVVLGRGGHDDVTGELLGQVNDLLLLGREVEVEARAGQTAVNPGGVGGGICAYRENIGILMLAHFLYMDFEPTLAVSGGGDEPGSGRGAHGGSGAQEGGGQGAEQRHLAESEDEMEKSKQT